MNALRPILYMFLMLAFCANLWAATYQVGPGRTYTTLQAVASLLGPGDVVEVDGDQTYAGGVTFSNAGAADNKIEIRGIAVNGNYPVISGGTNTVAFATPWPYSGPGADHYILDGFEITGGASRCIYHQAHDLTVRNTVVRDCPAHGILGADQGSGSLLLEHVEVYGCGSGTYRHQIYVATDQVNRPDSVLRIQFCYIHDGVGGNNIKSRAERNEIYYNWIEGAYYHELELIGPDPDGVAEGWTAELKREDSDVVGNVLRKTNTRSYITRVGGDGTGETDGRYRFVNNTVIANQNAVFRLFDGLQSIEMHNNLFYNPDGAVDLIRDADAQWQTGSAVIAGSNNWVGPGTLHIPAAWTDTRSDALPGCEDLAAGDFRPATGSPLIGAANSAPAGPGGFEFPQALFPPAFHPPQGTLALPAVAEARPAVSPLDIGAFERPAAGVAGDLDGDQDADLADGNTALKILSDQAAPEIRADYTTSGADVDANQRAGQAEAGQAQRHASQVRE